MGGECQISFFSPSTSFFAETTKAHSSIHPLTRLLAPIPEAVEAVEPGLGLTTPVVSKLKMLELILTVSELLEMVDSRIEPLARERSSAICKGKMRSQSEMEMEWWW